MLDPLLLAQLLYFRLERDWGQFHDPRNLSAALAIEAAELQEIFLWAKDADLTSRVEARNIAIEQELADIAIVLSYLCNDLEIDINDAVRKKLEINRLKYPIEKARGSSKKYDEL